jgi:hypothetical protein
MRRGLHYALQAPEHETRLGSQSKCLEADSDLEQRICILYSAFLPGVLLILLYMFRSFFCITRPQAYETGPPLILPITHKKADHYLLPSHQFVLVQ